MGLVSALSLHIVGALTYMMQIVVGAGEGCGRDRAHTIVFPV